MSNNYKILEPSSNDNLMPNVRNLPKLDDKVEKIRLPNFNDLFDFNNSDNQ